MEDVLFKELQDAFNKPVKEIAESKQTIYLPDTNNGGYTSGSISYDLSGWSNNGLMIDYANSMLVIPYLVVCTVDGGGNIPAGISARSLGLKNGFYNLINSIQVTVNGTTVVESQDLNNVYCQFKTITTWNDLDLKKYGASLGVAFDDTGISFEAAANKNGDGFSNNDVAFVDATQTLVSKQNNGLLKRIDDLTGFDRELQIPEVSKSATGAYGMNYFKKDVATERVWGVLAKIRMKDITDFFDKAGMLRNVSIRCNLTVNTCNFSVLVGAGPGMNVSSYTQTGGSSNNVMIPTLATGPNSVANGLITAGTYTFTTGVVNVAGHTHPAMTTTRWYASGYRMKPEIEAMISTKPPKPIRYLDVFTFKVNNTAVGSFQHLIGNGYPNIKAVIVQPFATPSVGGTGVIAISDYQNPFSSAPCTTMPFAIIDDYNVTLSGKPVYSQNYKYSFENFMFELASINSLNAGAIDGLCSGSIDEKRWNFSNRYYVTDCSRISGDTGIPMSVMIQGHNRSARPIDLIVHILYEKQVHIDLVTGQIAQK